MIMTEANKKYKVLIPTAGIGSRLSSLTKYLNKSLVSIGTEPVISKIIQMFPQNTEFVIALGYKGNLVKQFLSLAYPDRVFEYVTVDKYEGEGSGLGLTILSCEQFLQEPFVFCSCDTIVTDEIPYPNKNIVGFAKKNDKSQYRTLNIIDNKVVNILEKGFHNENSMPYIGLACIHDWQLFWEKMREGKENSVRIGEVYALEFFAKEDSLYSKEFSWFDTGNQAELQNTINYFKEENEPNILPKQNESIWFINDIVIKYSDDTEFIKNRVDRIKYLDGFVPRIISFTENMYSYKKASGEVLSKIDNLGIFINLLEYSRTLWKRYSLNEYDLKNFRKTCEKFYYTKTLERLNLYYKNFGVCDSETVVNNIKMPKLLEMLKLIDWEKICSGIPTRFHGDFHFENILYDKVDEKFTLLDWRQNFGDSLVYGDIYYDFAKLLHGLIICHELIHKDRFTIKIGNNVINYSFERKPILIDCEQFFYHWLNDNDFDVKKVKILTALIYLNIAALHHYPYCHLLYNLGKTMLYENLNINK